VTRRVGLLGGTFDPIHMGHLDAAAAAQRELGLTEVWIMPSHLPPHRPQPIASSHHRFAMVALAVAGRQSWRASDLEVARAEPSYTEETLARLHADGFAPDELVFIVGADAFADIASWYAYPRVLDMARFAVVSRPGAPVTALRARVPALAERMTDGRDAAPPSAIVLLDQPTLDVSATAIRRLLAEGRPVTGLVPPAVAQHIDQHGLYRKVGSEPGTPSRPGTRAAARLHGED
jgi:nicotinate-nucleotide adenylyltransferase